MRITEEQQDRYSFIFLVVLSFALAIGAALISLSAVNDSQHKWCQVVNTIVAIPVPQPANPKADPSRQRAWEFYTEFVILKRSLGC